ncbi:MAG: hypothetical protein MZV70_23130 [Desulfobacterales bacterium]|nr:hypothetical protein [Desulfobacterales bacterium]
MAANGSLVLPVPMMMSVPYPRMRPRMLWIDVDGFNLGMIHFERIAGNKSGLDNEALIGDGKLTRKISNERSNK